MYDATGNRTSTTNTLGAGHTWTATYDRLGRQLTSTNPLGQTVTTSYDPMGTIT